MNSGDGSNNFELTQIILNSVSADRELVTLITSPHRATLHSVVISATIVTLIHSDSLWPSQSRVYRRAAAAVLASHWGAQYHSGHCTGVGWQSRVWTSVAWPGWEWVRSYQQDSRLKSSCTGHQHSTPVKKTKTRLTPADNPGHWDQRRQVMMPWTRGSMTIYQTIINRMVSPAQWKSQDSTAIPPLESFLLPSFIHQQEATTKVQHTFLPNITGKKIITLISDISALNLIVVEF